MIYYLEVQSQIAPWGEHPANNWFEVFDRDMLEKLLKRQQGQRIKVFRGFPKKAWMTHTKRSTWQDKEKFWSRHCDNAQHGVVKKLLLTDFGFECIIGLNRRGIELCRQTKVHSADFAVFRPLPGIRRWMMIRLNCIGLVENPTMPINPIQLP